MGFPVPLQGEHRPPALLTPVPEHATQFPEEEGRGRLTAAGFFLGISGGFGISGLPPDRTAHRVRFDKPYG